MKQVVRFALLYLVLGALGVPMLFAQAAPVPSALASAKKVFVSNAGVDGFSYEFFQPSATPYEPYNGTYIALKQWGRYELVADPASADLVFEVSLVTNLAPRGGFHAYLQLKVIETKTHFTLWTVTQDFSPEVRDSKNQKALSKAIQALVEQLKGVVGAAHS